MWSTSKGCAEPTCTLATARGSRWCENHQTDNYEIRRERDRKQNPSLKWYGLAIWGKVKTAFRSAFPERAFLCQNIENGVQCRELATEIDHVIPHKGNWLLFLGGVNYENLQGLCKVHHSQKTAREDGGFGNAKR